MHTPRFLISTVALGATLALTTSAQQQPATPPPAPQQTEIVTRIGGTSEGLPPKIAVPPFIALGTDPETLAAAKTIGEVLWDDLEFEKEFYMIPKDTYRSIAPPAALDQVPLERWKELGADGLLVGSVRRRRAA